jgi:hypothetical protein
MSNEKQQTAVDWLEKNMWEHIEYKPTLEIQRIRKKIQQAKEMEEKQKGYTLEQMMDCWNAALKFEPHGSNFIDYITGLKKENK